MLTTPGNWRQVLRVGTTAVIKPRTGAGSAGHKQNMRDVEMSLVDQPPPYSPQ